MNYVEEVLDRATGEMVTVSKGDWITITELGARHGVGQREVRTVLRQLGVLVVEGTGSHQRHRLAAWVVRQRGGKRIEKRGAYPFDVVSPEMQEWIGERWSSALEAIADEATAPSLTARDALATFNAGRRKGPLTVQEAVSWLADHFSGLTQAEVAMVLSVTQQLVSRHLNVRSKQRREAIALRATDLEQRRALRSDLHGEEPATLSLVG